MAMELDEEPKSQRGEDRSHAFLLRCWHERGGGVGGKTAWRFSLTHIDSKRDKKGFADLEALIAYLHQILMEKNCTDLEG
jgi:hypothetical protein